MTSCAASSRNPTPGCPGSEPPVPTWVCRWSIRRRRSGRLPPQVARCTPITGPRPDTRWWPGFSPTRCGPGSEQRIDEGGERRTLREDDERAEEEQDRQDRQQPELLALPHEGPEFPQQIQHPVPPS